MDISVFATHGHTIKHYYVYAINNRSVLQHAVRSPTCALLGIIVPVLCAAYIFQCGLKYDLQTQSSHSGGVRVIENAACFRKNTVWFH